MPIECLLVACACFYCITNIINSGSKQDSELSARQLRSRHAIPSNAKDFSTKDGEVDKAGSNHIVVFIILGILAIGLVVFLTK